MSRAISRIKFDMQRVVQHGINTMFGGGEPIVDGKRLDANDTMVFARELEHVFKEVYEQDFPEYAGRSVVPVRTDVESGAESATHTEVTGYGEMKRMTNYTDDSPQLEETGTQVSQPIFSYRGSYSYSIQDMRRSQMTGRDLPARKGIIARELAERTLDSLLCSGDAAVGLQGISNLTGVPTVSRILTFGHYAAGAGATNWLNGASPAEILADIRALCMQVPNSTLNTHVADTVAIDTLSYNFLAFTNLNQGQTAQILSSESLLSYIQSKIPNLKAIVPWARLNTAGASSKTRAIAFNRSDKAVFAVLSQDFEQFPPQVRGLGWNIETHFRFGGVRTPKPLALAYMDGCGNA